jgi:virginiamycin A acetyltransferase
MTALIMPGVKIGNGAIISSRSVVVSDVPPTPSSGATRQR